jgi:hypothetical protein
MVQLVVVKNLQIHKKNYILCIISVLKQVATHMRAHKNTLNPLCSLVEKIRPSKIILQLRLILSYVKKKHKYKQNSICALKMCSLKQAARCKQSSVRCKPLPP